MAGEDFPHESNIPQEAADSAPMVDVVVDEVEGGSKKPWGLVAGAGALALVLAGGLFALSGTETETDTAQAEQTEQTQEGADPDEPSDEDVDDTPTTTAPPTEDSITEDAAIPLSLIHI